jgi:hypothetical protein
MSDVDPRISVFARRFAQAENGSQEAMAIAREIYAEGATEIAAAWLEGYGRGKAELYNEIAANLRWALRGALQVVPPPQSEDDIPSPDPISAATRRKGKT